MDYLANAAVTLLADSASNKSKRKFPLICENSESENSRSKLVRRWCMFEHFYTSLDRGFFDFNEFVMCLEIIGCPPESHITLTKQQWKKVRNQLGQPRRLSPIFLSSEREKLTLYREQARLIQRKGANITSSEAFPFEIKEAIGVGDRVIAYYARQQEFHAGFVLSIIRARHEEDSAQYLIQFDEAEIGKPLPPSLFSDLNLVHANKAPQEKAKPTSFPQIFPVSEPDVASSSQVMPRRFAENVAELYAPFSQDTIRSNLFADRSDLPSTVLPYNGGSESNSCYSFQDLMHAQVLSQTNNDNSRQSLGCYVVSSQGSLDSMGNNVSPRDFLSPTHEEDASHQRGPTAAAGKEWTMYPTSIPSNAWRQQMEEASSLVNDIARSFRAALPPEDQARLDSTNADLATMSTVTDCMALLLFIKSASLRDASLGSVALLESVLRRLDEFCAEEEGDGVLDCPSLMADALAEMGCVSFAL